MKTKFICIILAAITVIAFVFGIFFDVSLASGNTEKLYSEPALVGMFVTKEYLRGRIDAVLQEKVETDDETGEVHKHKEYTFIGLEGFPFYHCEIEDENGNYGYLHTDGIISDVDSRVNINDNGEENTVTGTIYTVETDGIFYTNPVFQDKNGNVWLEPGDGMQAAGHGSASIKLGNEIKIKTGKTEEIKKYEAELKIEYADPVKQVIVSEMDENDVLIRKTVYKSEEIPSEFEPAENTEYIIVNTVYTDIEGDEQEKRSTYDKTDTEFSYMQIREDGIGFVKCCEIVW